jgi:uncharacterized membrane protein
VRTNNTVKKDVLAAFWLLGVVAVLSIFAPISFNWRPDGMSIVLLAAVVIVQVVTAVHWNNGIPKEFVNDRSNHGRA